jgi:starch-binding outer membrane protein, SusD/RagB family
MITIINNAKISKVMTVLAFMALALLPTACNDLLEQEATTNLPADKFWKTEADATIALNGAYAAVRQCFDRDYYFDGQGEFVMVNGSSTGDTNPYNGGNYTPLGQNYGSAFDRYFRYLYGAVVRTNYVIENVTKMLETASPASKKNLESIIGEA